MGQEAGAALMGRDRAFVGQDVPSWSFGQPMPALDFKYHLTEDIVEFLAKAQLKAY